MRTDVRTIVSIWPRACRETRNLFQPTTEYTIGAAEKGSFSTLRIEPQTQPEFAGSGRGPIMRQVTAQELADDLVRCWTIGRAFPGMSANASPGIWIADEPEPTEAQIKASRQYRDAIAAQTAFMRGLVLQADNFERKGERHNIGEEHRVASAWLGITGRDWQDKFKSEQNFECPFCKSQLPVGAVICKVCQNVVDKAGYDAIKARLKGDDGPAQDSPKPTAAPQRQGVQQGR